MAVSIPPHRSGCLGHTVDSLWPRCLPSPMLRCHNERTFDCKVFVKRSFVRVFDRSFVYTLSNSANRSRRTEGAPNGSIEVTRERGRRNRRRSQGAERSTRERRERTRNLRQARSRIPSSDVHASDRSEGYDLGADERSDECDDRSLPRTSFAGRDNGRQVAFAPRGIGRRTGRSPVRLLSFVTTSNVRCRSRQRVVVRDNPPAPPRRRN